MNFNDNSGMLYADPNAYIQSFKPKNDKKKVVFQQPYENMANFYIDNNFKRGSCSCNTGKDKDCFNPPHEQCDCNKKENNQHHSNSQSSTTPFGLPFDFKSLLPLLGGLGGKGGGGLSSLISMLGSNSGGNNSNNTNSSGGMADMLKGLTAGGGLGDLAKLFTQNGGGLSSLLNIFKKPNNTTKINAPKSSDICIKEFKRVD